MTQIHSLSSMNARSKNVIMCLTLDEKTRECNRLSTLSRQIFRGDVIASMKFFFVFLFLLHSNILIYIYYVICIPSSQKKQKLCSFNFNVWLASDASSKVEMFLTTFIGSCDVHCLKCIEREKIQCAKKKMKGKTTES